MRGMVGLREIILFFGGGGTAILCEFTKLEFCDGLRWMERSTYGDYSLKCFNINRDYQLRYRNNVTVYFVNHMILS